MDGDDDTRNEVGSGPLLPDEYITSPDTNYTVPTGPLHQDAVWPTPGGMTEQAANEACEASIRASPVYSQCLQFTVNDRREFIRGCVADIKVTSSITVSHGSARAYIVVRATQQVNGRWQFWGVRNP